jgi:hypothetical protein
MSKKRPACGDRFSRQEQEYVCVGSREYETKNGYWIQLYALRSRCAECGAPYEIEATVSRIRGKHLVRRCKAHRRTGRRVKVRVQAMPLPPVASAGGRP